MTDLSALIKLQTWLSPAFPIGAFSYSSGLEAAIDAGFVSDKESLAEWLLALLETGSCWNDAVLLASSWQASSDLKRLIELAELATALCFSKLREKETCEQGAAFVKGAGAWGAPLTLPDNCPLPVALGAISGHFKIDREAAIAAYLHGFISNQIQAALRLMKLGQQGGLEVLAMLEDKIIEQAELASQASLEDLSSNTFTADIAAMQHETLSSRIFIT